MKFFFILVLCCSLAEVALADTIVFKSGVRKQGEIVERNDQSIKVDSGIGVLLTYYWDDIEKIEPKPLPAVPLKKSRERLELRRTTTVSKTAYQVTKHFSFHTLANLVNLEYKVPVPRNDIPNQKVYEIIYTPKPATIKPDEDGYQIAVFTFFNVKKNQNIKISISYKVEILDAMPQVVPGQIPILSEDLKTQLSRYLAGDAFAPTNDANFAKIIEVILQGEKNPYLQGKAIYNYLLDIIEYQDLDERAQFQKPEVTMVKGKGNCVDISLLFVTAARIVGIPARLVSGLVFQRKDGTATTLIGNKGHTWAEIYLSGYGWVPVDATFGKKFRDQYYCFSYRKHIREFYGQFFNKDAGAIYRGLLEAQPWPGQNVTSMPVEQKVDYQINFIKSE